MAVVLEKLICEEVAVNGLIQWLSSSSDDVMLFVYYMAISWFSPVWGKVKKCQMYANVMYLQLLADVRVGLTMLTLSWFGLKPIRTSNATTNSFRFNQVLKRK